MLEHKLNTHRNKFVAYRDNILKLWLVSSQEPLSDFEALVRDNRVKQLTLSSSTLDHMQESLNKVGLVFNEISGLSEEAKRDVISL